MIVKQEKLAKNYNRLSFTFESQDYNGKLTERLKEQARDVHLKGFRKGKIPTKLIYKLVGKPIKMEILSELLDEKMAEELKKLTYQNQEEDKKEKPSHFVVANPLIIKNEINEKTVSFQDDFLVEINIACFPYEQIDTDKIKYSIDKISVSNEDIESAVKSLQLEFAKKKESIKVGEEDLERLEVENPDKTLVVDIYSQMFNSKYLSSFFDFRSLSSNIQEKILKAIKERDVQENTDTSIKKEENNDEDPKLIDFTLSLEEAEEHFYLASILTEKAEKENKFTFEVNLSNFKLVTPSNLDQDFFEKVADYYRFTNKNEESNQVVNADNENINSENKESNQVVNADNENIKF